MDGEMNRESAYNSANALLPSDSAGTLSLSQRYAHVEQQRSTITINVKAGMSGLQEGGSE